MEVQAGKVAGDLEASSGVGSVTAKVAGVGGKAALKTGTGNLDAAFSWSAPHGDVSATCSVGNVKVALPANVTGKLSASAAVGHISVDGLAGVVVTKSLLGDYVVDPPTLEEA